LTRIAHKAVSRSGRAYIHELSGILLARRLCFSIEHVRDMTDY